MVISPGGWCGCFIEVAAGTGKGFGDSIEVLGNRHPTCFCYILHLLVGQSWVILLFVLSKFKLQLPSKMRRFYILPPL